MIFLTQTLNKSSVDATIRQYRKKKKNTKHILRCNAYIRYLSQLFLTILGMFLF